MEKLQVLIDLLTKGRNLHISVLDLKGILDHPLSKIEFSNIIHSKKFCQIAKSTEQGYRYCLCHKSYANIKAITEKRPFAGSCIYGLFESAVPVTVGDEVAAIVYVGNAIADPKKTEKQIAKTCRKTGVPPDLLLKETKNCERVENPEEMERIGQIVADYILLLHEKSPKTQPKFHWLTSLLIHHAQKTESFDQTLKDLARLYQKNEKYLGRRFKKEVGVSFHEYCMDIRLKKAASLLRESNEKIIEIALQCGFDNVSYFNRSFRKKYGISPGEYRKEKV